MKKMYLLAIAVLGLGLVACEPTEGPEALSKQEKQLLEAVTADVEQNILPTYKTLADKTMALFEDMEAILKADTTEGQAVIDAMVIQAAQDWTDSRQYWELSESFLFGPVNYYNVDPHIDSWPLDKDKMENLLARVNKGEQIGIEDLTYGTAGFHGLEYMLYNHKEIDGKTRPASEFTSAEIVYAYTVAKDLAAQAVLLEACWIGIDELNEEKKALLDELELEKPEFDDPFRYALTKLNSSKFKTYQAAAEQIIQGCIDIADEVGNTKIGMPNSGADEEQRNYIESPYALNSVADFVDNIKSIQNSFMGVNNHYSLYQFLCDNGQQKVADECKEQIVVAIASIQAIPEPFSQHAKSAEGDKAVEEVGEVLVKKLETVNTAVGEIMRF